MKPALFRFSFSFILLFLSLLTALSYPSSLRADWSLDFTPPEMVFDYQCNETNPLTGARRTETKTYRFQGAGSYNLSTTDGSGTDECNPDPNGNIAVTITCVDLQSGCIYAQYWITGITISSSTVPLANGIWQDPLDPRSAVILGYQIVLPITTSQIKQIIFSYNSTDAAGNLNNGASTDYVPASPVRYTVEGSVYLDPQNNCSGTSKIADGFSISASSNQGSPVLTYPLRNDPVNTGLPTHRYSKIPTGSNVTLTLNPPGGYQISSCSNAVRSYTNANGDITNANYYITQEYTITKHVYEDKSVPPNIAQDAGDPNYPNITVNLRNSSGGLIATGVTNASGDYIFPPQTYGNYQIETIAPSGYVVINPITGASSPTYTEIISGLSTNIRVNNAIAKSYKICGNPNGPSDCSGAAIGGIYLDSNDSGWYEPGTDTLFTDPATIRLKNAAGTVIDTINNTSGTLNFTDVVNGTYAVELTDSSTGPVPQGYKETRTFRYPYSPSASPVGYWNFNETSGFSASDSSGNNNTGTLINGASFTSARFGNGVNFDGVDDYVSVPDNANLRMTGDMTISFWMYKTSEAGDWQRLVGKGNGTLRNYGVWEEYGANKRLLFQQYNSGGGAVIDLFSNSSIEINTWYHISVVVSGGNAYIYINGNLDASGSQSGTPATSADPLTIGYAGYHTFFPGKLDEVKVYNYARTLGQIKEDAGTTATAYWKFDETLGNTAADSSGLNITGTLNGLPTWTTGQYGNALSFDGVDDYVNVGTGLLSLGGRNNFSISGWVKPTDTSGNKVIISRYNGSVVGEFYVSINNGRLRLSREVSPWGHESIGTIPSNQWTHVAITYDGSNIRFYINGILDKTESDTGFSNSAPGTNVLIGANYFANSPVNFFNGTIDEFKVYTYARSQGQILEDIYTTSPDSVVGNAQTVTINNSDTTGVNFLVRGWTIDGRTKVDYNHNAALDPEDEYVNGVDLNLSGEYLSSQRTTTTSGGAPAVGHWKFTEGAGISATDSSGNGYTGTITGASWTAGRYGNALSFDGVDDYVDFLDISALEPSSITVSYWCNASSLNTTQCVVSKHDTAGPSGYVLFLNSDNRFYFQAANGSGAWPTLNLSSSPITTPGWYHIAGTLDATASRLYMNGALVASSTGEAIAQNTKDLWINRNATSTTTYYPGTVDEVKIYNYARSAAQIQDDMIDVDSQLGYYRFPGLRGNSLYGGYWKFDEATGTSASDSSGNGITGTLSNGALFTTSGKYGNAVNFDGVDDYVNLGANRSLTQNVNGVTFSGWIYTNSITAPQVIMSSSINNSGNPSSTSRFGFDYSNGTSGQLRCFGRSTDTEAAQSVVTSGLSLTTSTWYHVSCVIDYANDTIRIYVNGAQQAITGTPNFSASQSPNSPSASNSIGSEDDGASVYFNGRIDEVKFYKYARTTVQILEDYNNATGQYSVGINQVSGFTGRFPSNPESSPRGNILLGPSSIVNFNITPLYLISGNIFVDSNKNSIKDATEQNYTAGPTSIRITNTSLPSSSGNPPVGNWRLDETTGNNATDSSGNNNTGTLINGASFTPSGKYGYGVNFDGVDDNVSINSSSSLNTQTAITIAAWIKPSGSGIRPIVEYNNAGTYGVHFWQYDSFDKLFVNFVDSAGGSHALFSPPGQFVAGNWYHVAATYDGTTGKLYVNDVQVASSIMPGISLQTSFPLYIGHRPSGSFYYNGQIDEVKVYNYARSAAQIKEDMDATNDYTQYAITTSTGAYLTGPVLISGNHLIEHTTFPFPDGYLPIYPLNGPPASFSVTVGKPGTTYSCTVPVCPVPGNPACQACYLAAGTPFNGSIQNLNFGITNSISWYQCQGGDCRNDTGITNLIPDSAIAACGGRFASIPSRSPVSAVDPGIFFSGTGSWDFCALQTSTCKERSSTTERVVGGTTAPHSEHFSPRIADTLSTEYGKLIADSQRVNIPIVELNTVSGCSSYASCSPDFTNSSTGIYRANGDLTLNDTTFPEGFPPPGLVGYWKFNEGSGTTAYDTSGNGNNGTFTNSGWSQDCKFGSCIFEAINGRSDMVVVRDPASGILDFSNTQDFTTEVWIKSTASESYIQPLWKGGSSDSTSGYDIEIDRSTRVAQCGYSDGSAPDRDVARGTTQIRDDGRWHFIACAMDRSGSATGTAGYHVFVDGVLEGSDTQLNEGNSSNSRNLRFGNGNNSTSQEYNGTVDNAKIYNRARTQAQIQYDMNNPNPKGYAILVNGDLTINGKITVPTGTFAIFSASRDIIVSSSVGENTAQIACDLTNPIHPGCSIEGIYSANRNFIIQGQGETGCAVGATRDKRLNIAGTIIANALLSSGGSVSNQRDLCDDDLYCPTYAIRDRPDFMLNAPEFLLQKRFLWKELAP